MSQTLERRLRLIVPHARQCIGQKRATAG